MFKYSVFITNMAKEDFKAGEMYYKQIPVSGLKTRFVNAVKNTLFRIEKHPGSFSVRYKNVRIAYTEKFPYAIHFFIKDKSVYVTAIIFDKRDPQVSMKRV